MATKRLCSITNCGKPHEARGWCAAHYARWRAHGDPLAPGVTRHGEPLDFLKSVVLAYEGNECLTWPYATSLKGYAQVRINGIKSLVHRVVCVAAHGQPPTPHHQAAHSCGRGRMGCVAKSHLSWKTKTQNEADKAVHGTIPKGQLNGQSKLTDADVDLIRGLRGKMTQREIAKRFGVSQSNVSMIQRKAAWAHIR